MRVCEQGVRRPAPRLTEQQHCRMPGEAILGPHGALYKQLISGTALSYGSWNKVIQEPVQFVDICCRDRCSFLFCFERSHCRAELPGPGSAQDELCDPAGTIVGAASQRCPERSWVSSRWGTSSPPRAALSAATRLSAPRGLFRQRPRPSSACGKAQQLPGPVLFAAFSSLASSSAVLPQQCAGLAFFLCLWMRSGGCVFIRALEF